MSSILQTILDMAGENFQLIRNDNFIGELKGLKNLDHITNHKYIAFFPETEIRKGDCLKPVSSDEFYYIVDVDVEKADGHPFQKRAFYSLSNEYYDANSVSDVNNTDTVAKQYFSPDMTALETAINSILSTNQSDVEKLIPRLSELMQQEIISKGSLKEFSHVLSKNQWLSDIVANYILEWLT